MEVILSHNKSELASKPKFPLLAVSLCFDTAPINADLYTKCGTFATKDLYRFFLASGTKGMCSNGEALYYF